MAFPATVPELTDGVVRLRAHRRSDLDRIVVQGQDSDSLRWTTIPRPYDLGQAQAYFARIEADWNSPDGHRYWAITEVADPHSRFLGTIDIRPKAGGSAEVGFGLHPDARGRGLMARSLRLLAGHWFGELGGQRLYWYADRGNFASWRAAWACGFRWAATLPQHNARLDGAADAWVASIGADGDVTKPATPWLEPPVAENLGIRIRPWRDDDGTDLPEPNHPAHWIPARSVPTSATFEEWLLRRRESMSRGLGVNWCIADTRNDAPLGEVLIFVHDSTTSLADVDTAELGYQLFPPARGKGVTKTAVRLALAHAFAATEDGGLGLRRLVAVTAEDNAASNKVLAGLGFTRWGHEADATAPDGSIGGAYHWSLTR